MDPRPLQAPASKHYVDEDIYTAEKRTIFGYRPGPLMIDPNFGVSSEHSIQSLYEWREELMSRKLL